MSKNTLLYNPCVNFLSMFNRISIVAIFVVSSASIATDIANLYIEVTSSKQILYNRYKIVITMFILIFGTFTTK